ncbi:MAG TPA: YvcK family protein [Candidatus Moranbacteria bacterium]|nr:YvcK family protein [Candidatus Moranbacteria bacterium]
MKTKKIVTIGGGTGSFTLLSGLKKYPVDISAIVSMADDGGSTGVLRDELGVLPPGDVRQCLVALSDSSEQLRTLMNYRFEEGALKGHSFGNIFLSALEKIHGSFGEGVYQARRILNVKGQVLPVTAQDARLFMELGDGTVLNGENEINHSQELQKKGVEKMYFSPRVRANKEAIRAIEQADLVVIGPGNHYCSILPNFLIKGIAEAVKKTPAKVVYNCNLVNKPGHSEGFTLDDYVEEVEKYIGKGRIDYATFNTKLPRKNVLEKYEAAREMLVTFDAPRAAKRNYRVVRTDMLSNAQVRYSVADMLSSKRAFIRHDSDKLAKVIMMIAEMGEYESILGEMV